LAALRDLLDAWDAAYGPVSAEAQEYAKAAFDELDGLAATEGVPESSMRPA
jgi:hypothetical protein